MLRLRRRSTSIRDRRRTSTSDTASLLEGTAQPKTFSFDAIRKRMNRYQIYCKAERLPFRENYVDLLCDYFVKTYLTLHEFECHLTISQSLQLRHTIVLRNVASYRSLLVLKINLQPTVFWIGMKNQSYPDFIQ